MGAEFNFSNDQRITSAMALDAAIMQAERRAFHTYFDTHVLEHEGSYIVHEQADYGNPPAHIIDSIAYTAAGQLDFQD
jgi:hypothetical protein